METGWRRLHLPIGDDYISPPATITSPHRRRSSLGIGGYGSWRRGCSCVVSGRGQAAPGQVSSVLCRRRLGTSGHRTRPSSTDASAGLIEHQCFVIENVGSLLSQDQDAGKRTTPTRSVATRAGSPNGDRLASITRSHLATITSPQRPPTLLGVCACWAWHRGCSCASSANGQVGPDKVSSVLCLRRFATSGTGSGHRVPMLRQGYRAPMLRHRERWFGTEPGTKPQEHDDTNAERRDAGWGPERRQTARPGRGPPVGRGDGTDDRLDTAVNSRREGPRPAEPARVSAVSASFPQPIPPAGEVHPSLRCFTWNIRVGCRPFRALVLRHREPGPRPRNRRRQRAAQRRGSGPERR